MKASNKSVEIPIDLISLSADLTIPQHAKGMVLFAHGSGSSRFSPRNKFVATQLNAAGFTTVLADLLTNEEESQDLVDASLRFNIDLLGGRLLSISRWLKDSPDTSGLNLGYFGASTGAAAALVAAAKFPGVKAIVSRGGRPDLATEFLTQVSVPTLLIVGELDEVVIDLNQAAYEKLASREKELKIVAGATHLFEEPGALEEVAKLARDWFIKFL